MDPELKLIDRVHDISHNATLSHQQLQPTRELS